MCILILADRPPVDAVRADGYLFGGTGSTTPYTETKRGLDEHGRIILVYTFLCVVLLRIRC